MQRNAAGSQLQPVDRPWCAASVLAADLLGLNVKRVIAVTLGVIKLGLDMLAAFKAGQNGGRDVFKQTIKFDDVRAAYEFDEHLAAFLRSIDAEKTADIPCVFTSSSLEGSTHLRVVQTDCADFLGRLLAYLSAQNFPPATLAHKISALANH